MSPPFEEDVNEFNSFPGSLPPSLERAKLAAQTGGIETSLGVRPLVYKVGRYGIGPNTVGILEELGHLVDLSPSPPFDYRSVHGQDFGRRGVKPAWYHSSTNIQLAYGVAEGAGLTTRDLSGHGNDGTLSSAIMWTKTGRGYRSLSGASTNGARARVCIACPESRAGSAAERTWECVSIFCQKIVVALIA